MRNALISIVRVTVKLVLIIARSRPCSVLSVEPAGAKSEKTFAVLPMLLKCDRSS